MNFDWADLAFGSTKAIKELEATFIVAPRELSEARFAQIVKQYLPKANLVLGLSKEPHVVGFEDQPQFRMLQYGQVKRVINAINSSAKVKRTVATLGYNQRDLPFILEKLNFQRVVLVNGSWKFVFHNSPAYYQLVKQQTPYEMISPFTDEIEALDYEKTIIKELGEQEPFPKTLLNDEQMLHLASEAAKWSFDHTFQTGVALGKRADPKARRFTALARSFNKVVPYQTYAWHFGSSREKYFSPAQDLNHYDTVHAEVELILSAQHYGMRLEGTTLFINLMPCPSCSRMLVESDIEEIVYSLDHSDGYAVRLFEAARKKVRRVVP